MSLSLPCFFQTLNRRGASEAATPRRNVQEILETVVPRMDHTLPVFQTDKGCRHAGRQQPFELTLPRLG